MNFAYTNSMVSDRDLIAAPHQPVVLEADHLILVRLEGCFLEFGLFNKTSKSQEQLSGGIRDSIFWYGRLEGYYSAQR